MTDREFLTWIYERLEYVHGENANYDYMHRLRKIIDNLAQDSAVVAEPKTPYALGNPAQLESAYRSLVSCELLPYTFEEIIEGLVSRPNIPRRACQQFTEQVMQRAGRGKVTLEHALDLYERALRS